MKLEIELVPSSCWYSNLRNKVSQADWDMLRRRSYKEAGYRCCVCVRVAKLFCHEVWEYDDIKFVQKLVGFTALCEACHNVKHLGYAGILAGQGKLDMEGLIKHFMWVNQCSRAEFDEHERLAWELWEKRSEHEWKIDLGEYGKSIKSDLGFESGHVSGESREQDACREQIR